MADKKFIDEMVKAHNDYRKHHQAEPLSHSEELSAQAQKWADHLASTGSFQHSDVTLKGERLGENIAKKWSSQPDAYTGQEVTDQWYSEVKKYQFGGEPSSTMGTGHFTQVVWKGSKELGVGRAVTPDGKIIVVANYRPAGNMVGSFAANVLPPKDGKIVLPPEPVSQPTTTTTHVSRSGGLGEGTFPQRFEDMQKDFFTPGQQASQSESSGGESRSVRTFTVTEGVGPNKVTKTITEETIIKANGEKIVNRRETISSGEATPSQSSDIGRSSDSSPERGGHSKTKPTSEPSKPQKMSDFQQDCLKAHNSKRALHAVPALSLASDLSEHAQKWAEHLASNDMFEHSKCMVNGERVGENIACSWSSAGADYTGDQVVDEWYSEIKKHDYTSDGAMGSGHFSQVVWKGSKELGVGKAMDGKGKCIVVCNYRPAGNMRGSWKDNVFPPK